MLDGLGQGSCKHLRTKCGKCSGGGDRTNCKSELGFGWEEGRGGERVKKNEEQRPPSHPKCSLQFVGSTSHITVRVYTTDKMVVTYLMGADGQGA